MDFGSSYDIVVTSELNSLSNASSDSEVEMRKFDDCVVFLSCVRESRVVIDPTPDGGWSARADD